MTKNDTIKRALISVSNKTGVVEFAEKLAQKAIEVNPSKKDIYQDTLDQIKAARTHPLK